MVTTTEGDLIALAQADEFDVIAHGCNCQCVMGAGIVETLKATFPAAFEANPRRLWPLRKRRGYVDVLLVRRRPAQGEAL